MKNTDDKLLREFLARHDHAEHNPAPGEWSGILEKVEEKVERTESRKRFFPWLAWVPVSLAAAFAATILLKPSTPVSFREQAIDSGEIESYLSENTQYSDDDLEQPGSAYLELVSF